MALSFLRLVCLLLPLCLAQGKTCQGKTCALADDAQVLLQTGASVQKRGVLIDDANRGSEAVTAKTGGVFDRPNVGKGPDHVEFGMRVKKFYGVNLPDNMFELDMVLTLKWTDDRVKTKIPKGSQNITLSQADAEKEIWLPEITVTDRNIHKKDVISTGVMLYKTGKVIKVQRLIVIIKDKFDLKEYPFDAQDLPVDIASSQYMSSAVVLVPSSEASMSGVSTSLFKGSYTLDKWSVDVENQDTGLLAKSRGILHIIVQHNFMGYMTSHLVPSLCIMLLSCGAFFFPFIAPFVTPRIGLMVLAYLSFTNLANASDKAIPPVHATSWNDVLNQNIELVMIIGNLLNLYTEYRHHVTKVEALAKRINNECKIIMPSLCLSLLILTMTWGAMHWGQVAFDIMTKVLLLLGISSYFFFNEFRTKAAVQDLKAKEAAAA